MHRYPTRYQAKLADKAEKAEKAEKADKVEKADKTDKSSTVIARIKELMILAESCPHDSVPRMDYMITLFDYIRINLEWIKPYQVFMKVLREKVNYFLNRQIPTVRSYLPPSSHEAYTLELLHRKLEVLSRVL